jgi:hypothetical protein
MLNQHLSGLLGPGEVGVLLVDRGGFFLPTKSLRGEDSLEETAAALAAADARRLADAGAAIDPAARVELDPCLDDVDLRDAGAAAGWRLEPGAAVCLAVRHGFDGAPPFSPGLHVGRDARLVVESDLPFGAVRVDGARAVTVDAAMAGRIRLGAGVVVEDGAEVLLSTEGDGRVEVRDGARLGGRVEVRARAGEVARL